MTLAEIAKDAPASSTWRTVAGILPSRENLHRKPFRISHDLANSTLFDLHRLAQVANEAFCDRVSVLTTVF